MNRYKFLHLLCVLSVFILSGCVVRSYQVLKDRVDQDLTGGNQGYIQGAVPQTIEPVERKTKRTTHVLEVELHPIIKVEKKSEAPKQKEKEIQQEGPETKGLEVSTQEKQEVSLPSVSLAPPIKEYEQYTVQDNDTLQKISQKFYGTTNKWDKIFQANKDVLKSPDRIYPGQIIKVPIEGMKETKENLK